jgi:hypothetical protein
MVDLLVSGNGETSRTANKQELGGERESEGSKVARPLPSTGERWKATAQGTRVHNPPFQPPPPFAATSPPSGSTKTARASNQIHTLRADGVVAGRRQTTRPLAPPPPLQPRPLRGVGWRGVGGYPFPKGSIPQGPFLPMHIHRRLLSLSLSTLST